MKLVDKEALVAEIERRIKNLYPKGGQGMVVTKILKDHYEDLLSFLNSLEVKEVDFWHKQSEEDIDDSINDWELHTYLCLMSDGLTQRFTGIRDESYDGSINTHLDCTDDNYDWEYDNIIYWIETPNVKAQKGEKA